METAQRQSPPTAGGLDPRPIEAYPSLRSAAKFVGISAAALSRRKDVERVRAGREERIPAAEVVRLAGVYRRRPPSQVAAELVQHAIRVDPGLDEAVGREVDAALEQVPPAHSEIAIDGFLRMARQLLPAELAAQIKASVDAERPGESAVGWSPAE